ncbi:MraY family glycosyltransferase [Thiocystis violascens]|uniref:UDP-N-acetylmuramyl pentapeptide phosphotransferase/UDP-N-acetylglucosamine-1-phosphate transferase n=1 Tax=Thiocystis violascens (strain ATCC 17096 / DSM 198 / 6111) TaxID=765911 RepID=I3YCI3_THIV6|nr:glycosyltransferase family 4 protein [Thiocystis violascens]AFL74701.1 UDP-N-acetylmuramyl pentapeptide phosphotransferase/UDP-N-acetylglucosamine-1-phosphate transferase [Thiocystis violascens DSM 198]
MNPESPILAALPVASLFLSLLATRWLIANATAGRGPMDVPNARSLHRTPVPRTGGLAVLSGLLGPLLILAGLGVSAPEFVWLFGALALVATVSFFDDLGDVSPWMRLFAHFLSALLLIVGGFQWSVLDLPGVALALPTLVGGGLTILYSVWMINLYNFMDGMDGFASGMAVFGFAALAILGWSGGEPLFGLVATCIVAAAAGFLSGNYPPARIFLGDAGSSSLGILAAGLSLWGVQLGLFPIWTAWLAFSPFIVDATWTLLTRLIRRERIWEPHRSHHYQRLVLAGWGHRKTLLRAYVLMAAAAACAVASPRLATHEQWLLLAAWAAIYVLIHIKIALIERTSTPLSASAVTSHRSSDSTQHNPRSTPNRP